MKRAWLAVLVGSVAAGCGGGKASPAAAPSAAASPVLPAEVREVAEANASAASPAPGEASKSSPTLEVSGEFVSPAQSEVGARIQGRVAKVLAEEGQHVRLGQPLLQLETEYLQLDVQRAAAELARARASQQEAEREHARKQDLLAKGSVSQAAYERALSGHEQATAGVAGAESALGLAKQRLADATLVAPVEGVVVARRTDPGERLGDGSVPFVVAQTAPLRLRFRVPERYLARLGTGRKVQARVDPYPQEVFTGSVTLVGGSVDPQTRTVVVEAEFPNRDGRLKPGLFARVVLDVQG